MKNSISAANFFFFIAKLNSLHFEFFILENYIQTRAIVKIGYEKLVKLDEVILEKKMSSTVFYTAINLPLLAAKAIC